MSRKRTGLRNRSRSGRSMYSVHRKASSADRYGAWVNGRQDRPDVVAGRILAYRDRASLRLEMELS